MRKSPRRHACRKCKRQRHPRTVCGDRINERMGSQPARKPAARRGTATVAADRAAAAAGIREADAGRPAKRPAASMPGRWAVAAMRHRRRRPSTAVRVRGSVARSCRAANGRRVGAMPFRWPFLNGKSASLLSLRQVQVSVVAHRRHNRASNHSCRRRGRVDALHSSRAARAVRRIAERGRAVCPPTSDALPR